MGKLKLVCPDVVAGREGEHRADDDRDCDEGAVEDSELH
jgi:hypothetical protein